MRIFQKLFVIGLLCTAGFPASAKQATVTLLQGGQQTDGSYLVGLHLKLAPGWITYWREPGEAGIAPKLDFKRSENLKSVSIDFSLPKPFDEGPLKVFGYDGEVVFPLHVMLRNPRKPLLLRLKFDYGVCEKICVPESASFEQILEKVAVPEHLNMIEQARRLAPSRDRQVSIYP